MTSGSRKRSSKESKRKTPATSDRAAGPRLPQIEEVLNQTRFFSQRDQMIKYGKEFYHRIVLHPKVMDFSYFATSGLYFHHHLEYQGLQHFVALKCDFFEDLIKVFYSNLRVSEAGFLYSDLVSDESMWIVDSGATLHVTPRKEFFTSYTSGDFGVLKMGNDGVSKVIGVGDVCLQTNMRMHLLLRGVKHAPDVRFNLISVQMLDDDGYDNHIGSGKWKLTKVNLVVARGEKNSKLYWKKALVAKNRCGFGIEKCRVGEMFSLHGWKLWVYAL
uniref:Retrovirus-related Pol polyprotein from transposon TNT 1-94 n=1 Tax=Cajanus cajan TaxID=3821 RepID=A0A151QW09_CAJCA|nr:Retrovirus-related Pol polyprotein from transposon TNT 1-94 [Cajanus cajan]